MLSNCFFSFSFPFFFNSATKCEPVKVHIEIVEETAHAKSVLEKEKIPTKIGTLTSTKATDKPLQVLLVPPPV